MILGVDFGTTNSVAAARLDDGTVHPVELEPGSAFPYLLPSCWYFPEDRNTPVIGGQAKTTYVEEMFEGRFVSSLKRYLGNVNLENLLIRNRPVPVENILSLTLERIRLAAEEQFGPVTEVRAGRPVVISDNDEANAKLEERLSNAYNLAGFPQPSFVPEPVAAACKYKRTLAKPETVVVADFGGGTLDYCLCRLEPEASGREDAMLGVRGVRLGGDDMTATLMRLFWEYFGSACQVKNFAGTEWVSYPSGVYHRLGDWRSIWDLHEAIPDIEATIRWGTTDEEALRRLIALLETHTHFQFLDQLEDTKISLSAAESVAYDFKEPPIDLSCEVTQTMFEGLARSLMAKAREILDGAFVGSGVVPEEVESVFFTGGSSRIPMFRRTVREALPQATVHDKDTFNSVALGLASMAL